MLVNLEDITIRFVKEPLLKDINLRIEENDRIGLVGDNGTGKTTLLKIICDKITYEQGKVSYKSNLKIGFLEQKSLNNNQNKNAQRLPTGPCHSNNQFVQTQCMGISNMENENTIMDELRSVFNDVIFMGKRLKELEEIIAKGEEIGQDIYNNATDEYSKLQENFEKSGGYSFEVDIKIVLNGMGFADKDPNMKTSLLSGGEKTRLELAKLLLEKPEVLLLDEPTNHLDFETLLWLENYLASYKGAILSVSHDRYFLDKTASRIWEIENTSIIQYKGNYSKFKILREERLQNQLKQYEAQQEEIKKMKDYIAKNIARASTSNSAKSRVHALERMEIIEKPKIYDKTVKLDFTYNKESVKSVLEVSKLELTVGEERKVLASDLNFELRRGEKIAIIGANGIGKSTFIKTILDYLDKEETEVVWGKNVSISYYEQENTNLNPNNTALEELWDTFPRENEFTIRSALARVLLQGENVFKPVFVLSGGEKAKLAFAKVFMEKRNTLVLDEPTNHLDLTTKEVLEQSLVDFEGTLLFISHDRYLLNKVPTKIAEMTKDGFVIYNGNFDFYINEKQKIENLEKIEIAKNNITKNQNPKTNPNNKKAQRAIQAQKRIRISQLENLIHETEQNIEELTYKMNDPKNIADYQLISKIYQDLENEKSQLYIYMEEWTATIDN